MESALRSTPAYSASRRHNCVGGTRRRFLFLCVGCFLDLPGGLCIPPASWNCPVAGSRVRCQTGPCLGLDAGGRVSRVLRTNAAHGLELSGDVHCSCLAVQSRWEGWGLIQDQYNNQIYRSELALCRQLDRCTPAVLSIYPPTPYRRVAHLEQDPALERWQIAPEPRRSESDRGAVDHRKARGTPDIYNTLVGNVVDRWPILLYTYIQHHHRRKRWKT